MLMNKRLMKIGFVFLLLLFSKINMSQNFEKCGSMLLLQKAIKENNQIESKRNLINQKVYAGSLNNVTIPVVVHVVYSNAQNNISDSRIFSQIQVLNEDFRRTNSDAINTPSQFQSIVADMSINFCLATKDPDGNPTNGIIRKFTNKSGFSLYDTTIHYNATGGSDAWDSDKYLNIWVCNINGGILGWAQFPYAGTKETDGVVINHENFGINLNYLSAYNLGRTTTHEVGHWLNLFHVWGDNTCGDDFVFDTPTQEQANYGCKIHPHISCQNSGDMFMNFMDYSDDDCMNSFTNGQKSRAWNCLLNYRDKIFISDGCDTSNFSMSCDASIESIIHPLNNDSICDEKIHPAIVIKNNSSDPMYTLDINYRLNGQQYTYQSWSGNLSQNMSDTVFLASLKNLQNNNILEIEVSLPNNKIDLDLSNNFLSTNYYSNIGRTVNIQIQTDNYAQENQWYLYNDVNNSIIDSGVVLNNNTLYEREYCLTQGCYHFIIFDSGNDGICCNFGNGYFNAFFGDSLIGSGGSFVSIDSLSFCISNENQTTNLNNLHDSVIEIYPNPATDNLFFKLKSQITINNPIFVDIYDIAGNKIISKKITSNNLNISSLENGVYVLFMSIDSTKYTKKFVKQ